MHPLLNYKNFDRVTPQFWIAVFAIVFIFLGLVVEVLDALIWVGGFLVVVFVGYFVAKKYVK